MTEKIHTTDDLFKQINDRLAIIGETPDAYFLCQCVETLKQQGQTIDIQAAKIEALEREKQVSALEYLGQCREHLGRIEALEKDAKRYQWLCDKGHSYHGAMSGSASMSISRGPYILLEPPSCNGFSNMILTKQVADVIIDAAIAGERA